jgi:hypothetical protein
MNLILMDGQPNRVDPDKWRPLIMSFQQFYGLGEQCTHQPLPKYPSICIILPDRERAIDRTLAAKWYKRPLNAITATLKATQLIPTCVV